MHSPRQVSDDAAQTGPPEPGYRWYHAVAVGAAANVPSVAAGGAMGARAYYTSLRRPRGAPPDWPFAPVWLGLDALSLWAGLRLANAAAHAPGRRQALALEGAFWTLFAAAKCPATRAARIAETISLAAQNRRANHAQR